MARRRMGMCVRKDAEGDGLRGRMDDGGPVGTTGRSVAMARRSDAGNRRHPSPARCVKTLAGSAADGAMRRLVILRHAQAEDGDGKRDFDRCLTAKGEAQATRMGGWLERHGIRPDHVVTSPAPRALDTARLACAELGIRLQDLRRDPQVYDASTPTLLRVLAGVPTDATCVLLVGHNPGLEDLAVHLTGDDDLRRTGLPKGGIVVADLPDDWRDLGAKVSDNWLRTDPASV